MRVATHVAAKMLLATLATLALLPTWAGSVPLYFTSFEEDTPFIGGPEWQKPPDYPWMQNSNDPMNIVTGTARTGNKSANQAETFSQWAAMRDFGVDLYDNFYVKAWVNFQNEKERLVNIQPPCTCAYPEGPPNYYKDYTDVLINKGFVTAADDGGQEIVFPGWPSGRLSMPSITDSSTYFHSPAGQTPMAYFRMTSGDAIGKEFTIEAPKFYMTGGAPYGYNPTWNLNQTLQVSPRDPNTLNPVAAGVKPGDSYEVRGTIAPLYRAIQMWISHSERKDFAKFGIWHRYTGDPTCSGGVPNIQCSDSNNWKYFTRNDGQGGVNGFLDSPWVDTGIHRGYDFTGWHSIEIRVYGDNEDPQKHQKMHFVVDGDVIATAPRYTAEGPVPFNRMEIGGLAVSQETAQWDDIEIGLLPEAGEVLEVQSIGAVQTLADGTWVSLPQSVVNIVGEGWFQIQAPGRASGLRCLYSPASLSPQAQIAAGDVIIPSGKVTTINGCEKVLLAMNPHLIARGATVPVDPVIWANARDMRADAPSMKGLYVSMSGKLVDGGDNATYFYISDGSSHDNPSGDGSTCFTKVKVYAPGSGFIGFEYITARGVLGCEDGNPVIYVSDPEQDLQVLSDFEFWSWWRDCP